MTLHAQMVIPVYECACSCVHTCVRSKSTSGIIPKQGRHLLPCFVRQGFKLTWNLSIRLGWQASKGRDPPASDSPS